MDDKITYALYVDGDPAHKIRISASPEKIEIITHFLDIINTEATFGDEIPYLIWQIDNNNKTYTL